MYHQLPLGVPGGAQRADDGGLLLNGAADGDGEDERDHADEDVAHDGGGSGVAVNVRGGEVAGLPGVFRQKVLDLPLVYQRLGDQHLQKVLPVLRQRHLVRRLVAILP